MKWWPFSSEQSGRSSRALHYRDIPKQRSRHQETECYPQKSRPFPNLSLQAIVARYSIEIRSVLGSLPLNEAQIDSLFMPVIQRLINLVHLLPASESQHHSGIGGLLVHSLEAARYAVWTTSTQQFDSNAIPQVKYMNRPKWQVGACLLMLMHDIGKVEDMIVTDEHGRTWNPNVEGLMTWLQSESTSYFVDWIDGREHKGHERRALRFGYRQLIPNTLVSYLTEESGNLILNAIEDALLSAEGPFAFILLSADGRSIADDASRRKRIASDHTYMSSPLVTPIIDAMCSNIKDGTWTVNDTNGKVFVTPDGIFITSTSETGRSIRQNALYHNCPQIPLAIDRIERILADSGFIASEAESQEPTHWELMLNDRAVPVFKFLDADRLFKDGAPMPKEWTIRPLNDDGYASSDRSQSLGVGLMAQSTASVDYGATVRARLCTSSFQGINSNVLEADPHNTLSEEEAKIILPSPMSKDNCRDFVRRLLLTVRNQILDGEGFLITDISHQESMTTCSSIPAEQIAKNHQISEATLEALAEVLKTDQRLILNLKNHLFQWYEDK